MIDRSPLMLILYLCGITGFILTVGDVIDLSFQYYFIVLTFTSILTAVFWFLYFFHNKLFIISSAIFTGLASIIIIPQIFSMSVELKALALEIARLRNILDRAGCFKGLIEPAERFHIYSLCPR